MITSQMEKININILLKIQFAMSLTTSKTPPQSQEMITQSLSTPVTQNTTITIQTT